MVGVSGVIISEKTRGGLPIEVGRAFVTLKSKFVARNEEIAIAISL